jgi:2-dehydro-3-deoxyphosphogluconate aldolase / (4S)-4-hydroxy-2-oxoglutarate aldolase
MRTREEVWQYISEIGIVPVVRAPSPELAIAAAKAVCAGGIPIVEITMTVPGAIGVIQELTQSMGRHILVGAGTVLGAETAARCLDAGAEFLVSPGFDFETVKLANLQERLIMAGALTPTEVITAWKAGSDFVKVFPCGNVGGASYIRALRAALPQIPMVPTGGVNLETASDFLCAGASALGVGGELISAAALKSGNWDAITENARLFVTIVRQARGEASQSAASD